MKQLEISNLADILQAESATNTKGTICGVTIDSRIVKTGDCFFAIRGERFDGCDFVAQAFDKGASCAVVPSDYRTTRPSTRPILKVADTIKALGTLAGWYRRKMDFKLIAITGSVGKTSTRQIIHHVLSRSFRCHQAPKNFNNYIGLPLTILGADPDHQIVVAELGSSFPGEIAYLSKMARPDSAVITNVSASHLDGLDNIETIIEEKSSITEGLVAGGELIINGDNAQLVERCKAKGLALTIFGKNHGCDIRAEQITCAGNNSRFAIQTTQIELPLPGQANVQNALAAWAVCKHYGINLDAFAAAVKSVSAVPMRTQIVRFGKLTVINDCYNASPASMKNALDILENLCGQTNKRAVFICGDMAELARQDRALHEKLGLQIARANVQLLITVGELAKIAAAQAKKSANQPLQTESFDTTIAACSRLKELVTDSDIVLVKGSRTIGLEKAVERLEELFS